MHERFADICCACLAAKELGALAELRTVPGVLVYCRDDLAWVRWELHDPRVLRCLLPVPGVRLFAWRQGLWFAPGKAMPIFPGPPAGDYVPLHQVLVPAAVQPLPAPVVRIKPLQLSLVSDARPKPATALLTTPAALLAWADTVPSFRLAQLRCACREQEVLVLAARLPALAEGQRFWGSSILKPLGYRLEPDVSERTLRAALDVPDGAWLLVSQAGVEVVPEEVCQPLQRASLRRLLEEARP